ncbi:unnamed protein product [Durusdinium trenchii]|uniref:Uncharacterized protein n=1 Tax=Durusdinium trenchii TaxID=1381693 RepID=A0ABP0RLQ8_9DINO
MAAWLEEVHDDVLRRIFEFGALVEWQRALQSSWRLWVNTWAYLRRLEELSLTTSDDLRRAGALERVGGLVALERLRVVEVEHCAEAESVLCGFDHLRSLELKECHFLSDAASRYTAGRSGSNSQLRDGRQEGWGMKDWMGKTLELEGPTVLRDQLLFSSLMVRQEAPGAAFFGRDSGTAVLVWLIQVFNVPNWAALSGCELVLVLQRPALGLGAPEPAELRRRRLRTSHRAGDFGANRDTGG